MCLYPVGAQHMLEVPGDVGVLADRVLARAIWPGALGEWDMIRKLLAGAVAGVIALGM